MKKFLSVLSIIFIISCTSEDVFFEGEINEIESLLGKDGAGNKYYKPLVFKISRYSELDEIIEVRYLFKGDTCGVGIDFSEGGDNIFKIVSLGKESDKFVHSLIQLYEIGNESNAKMKNEISFTISNFENGKDTNPPITKDMFWNIDNDFQMHTFLNKKNKSHSVDLRLGIDMRKGELELYNDDGGITRRAFVKSLKG